MTKLLSDEKKLLLAKNLYGAPLHVCIDTIEAAVLEAQGKQEPFCYVKEEWLHYEQCSKGDDGAIACYAAPVVQPDMAMVPREPTDEYRRVAASNGVTYESVADAAYRAMIAAAEGKE